MADYLIQDSTLTDIADAIRAKDGSSAPILTEDMAAAIAAIPSGGGGATAEGTFTFASSYKTTVGVTHNLNTTDIAGIVYIEPDENDEIVALGQYTVIFGSFIAYGSVETMYNGITLKTPYSAEDKTKEAVFPGAVYPTGSYRSSATNSDASWIHANQGSVWVAVIDANTCNIKSDSGGAYFRSNTTYHWKIWKLG